MAIEDRLPGFATLAVHAGKPAEGPAASSGEAAPLTRLEAFGSSLAHLSESTTAVLEERLAALEGGTGALAVASGPSARLVAFHAIMSPGEEFVASTRLHESSVDQFNHAFTSFGWKVAWADPEEPGSFEAAIGPRTKAIFVESLGHPGSTVADLAALAGLAKRAGVPLIVDNTLATPYLCRPIDHGADVVIHSLAQYLGGHGGTAGGVIVDGGSFNWSRGRYPLLSTPREENGGAAIAETYGNFAFAAACRLLSERGLGQSLSPLDAFMVLAGIETLPLRMARQSESARAVAEFLSGDDGVSWTSHAGLPGDRHHNLMKTYLPAGGGAMLSFGLRAGAEAERSLLSRVGLIARHAGGPTTRSAMTAARQDGLTLSVGIEDTADIIADLQQALAGI